jgi:hypothetical protein
MPLICNDQKVASDVVLAGTLRAPDPCDDVEGVIAFVRWLQTNKQTNKQTHLIVTSL